MVQNHIDETTMADYVLGNLSSYKKAEVEHHINTCEICQKDERYWQQLLTDKTEHQPSPNLTMRIQESIDKKANVKRKRNWKKQSVVLASFAAAILLAFVFYKSTTNSPLSNRPEQTYVMTQHDQMHEQKLMEKPDTD